MDHHIRSAYCKDTFWCEPGARNARGEFKHWLYIHGSRQFVAPWPFAHAVTHPLEAAVAFLDLSASVLLAHYHIHKFENWPGEWFALRKFLYDERRYGSGLSSPYIRWGLSRFPARVDVMSETQYVPKEFIDAIIGPSKAGG
jgi:hypothetical protein